MENKLKFRQEKSNKLKEKENKVKERIRELTQKGKEASIKEIKRKSDKEALTKEKIKATHSPCVSIHLTCVCASSVFLAVLPSNCVRL